MKLTKPILIALLCISLAPIIMTMQNMQRLQPAARQLVRRSTQAPQVLNVRKNITPSPWYILNPGVSRSILTSPQRRYHNYRNYYGNQAGQQQYQKPLNYRLLAGASFAAALAALQKRRAESAALTLDTYTIINKHGAQIKLILWGDFHLENAESLTPYLSDLMAVEVLQAGSFYLFLTKHAIPTRLYAELMRGAGPASITNQQLTVIPSDKRSEEDVATQNFMIHATRQQKLAHFGVQEGDDESKIVEELFRNTTPYPEQQKQRAYDAVNRANIEPDTKLVAREEIDAIITGSLSARNFTAAMENFANLVDDASLICDIFDALENSQESVILIVNRGAMHSTRLKEALARKGINPTESINPKSFEQVRQASETIVKWAHAVQIANQNPDMKNMLVAELTRDSDQESREQQGASSPDDIIKFATRQTINKIVVPNPYDTMTRFIEGRQ